MKTRLFQCSTLLGLATMSRLRDVLEREDDEPFRNLVLVSVNNRYPELDDPFESAGELTSTMLAKFDGVIRLNELIAPLHPRDFAFHPSWFCHRRLWLDKLGAEQIHELVVESIQVPPALTLVQLFSEARIRVYSDGLMVYSPTRFGLASQVLSRVSDVYYVNLLGGHRPLLLQEARPKYISIAPDEVRPYFARGRETGTGGEPICIFLGQSMSQVEIMTEAEELALYRQGLDRLLAMAGSNRVAFKPHPACGRSVVRALLASAQSREKKVELLSPEEPLESILEERRVLLVSGVFSTGLFTAREMYGVPALTFGTMRCLASLRPTANSNRIPLVAADMLLPTLDQLEELMRAKGLGLEQALPCVVAKTADRFADAQLAVGYVMQPSLLQSQRMRVQEIERSGAIERLQAYYGPDRGEGEESAISQAFVRGFQLVARPFLDSRKRAKLEINPQAFLLDSRTPALIRLAAVHRGLRKIRLKRRLN